MTATITDHLGQRLTGEVRCWMGRRVVEIQTADGARHIGHLAPDPAHVDQLAAAVSSVDGAA